MFENLGAARDILNIDDARMTIIRQDELDALATNGLGAHRRTTGRGGGTEWTTPDGVTLGAAAGWSGSGWGRCRVADVVLGHEGLGDGRQCTDDWIGGWLESRLHGRGSGVWMMRLIGGRARSIVCGASRECHCARARRWKRRCRATGSGWGVSATEVAGTRSTRQAIFACPGCARGRWSAGCCWSGRKWVLGEGWGWFYGRWRSTTR